MDVRDAHEKYALGRRAAAWRWIARELVLLICLSMVFVSAGCAPSSSHDAAQKSVAKFPGGTVQVVYSNTLYWPFQAMWPRLGALGYKYVGTDGGYSASQAKNIAGGGLTADVFIGESTSGTGIFATLQKSAHGNLAPWYITFGSATVVVAYDAKSKFAAQLAAAAAGKQSWYSVLQQPGFRLGRIDPNAYPLNPRGVSALLMMELAEGYYNQPGLTQAVLQGTENRSQMPGTGLTGMLQKGQLDAALLYLADAQLAHLKYIPLPDQINLSNPADAATYAGVRCTIGNGITIVGAPITYSLTILGNAKNKAGADAFARALLAGPGHTALNTAGVRMLPPVIVGDHATVPPDLRGLIP